MKQSERIKQLRFETKSDVAKTGLAMTGTGIGCSGCLVLTVVGIPFIPFLLVLSAIGGIITLVSAFLKTQKYSCPKCGTVNTILKRRKAFSCKECDATVVAQDAQDVTKSKTSQ